MLPNRLRPAPGRARDVLAGAASLTLLLALVAAAPAAAEEPDPASAEPEVRADGERWTERRVAELDFDLDIGIVAHEDDSDTTRWRLLDLWIVSLLEIDRSANGDSRVTVLDGPGFALFSSERVGERSRTRVLDVPLFSLYRRDVGRTPRRDLRWLDLPLIGALYRESETERGVDWRVLFLFRASDVRAAPPAP